MTMCPYCGTQNRRGSKHCANCGQRIDTVHPIRCPSCDGPNPSDAALCQFCGSSLSLVADEEDAGREPYPPTDEETVESRTVSPDAGASAQQEPPSWLYRTVTPEHEQLAHAAEAPLELAAQHEEQEANKHLTGIGGVLPSRDGWVSASLARHLHRAETEMTESPVARLQET